MRASARVTTACPVSTLSGSPNERSLPGSFGHLAAAEIPGNLPGDTGRLVHLQEDRSAVV